jgi:hypothetical protein
MKRIEGQNLYKDHHCNKVGLVVEDCRRLKEVKKPPLVKVAENHMPQMFNIPTWGPE